MNDKPMVGKTVTLFLLLAGLTLAAFFTALQNGFVNIDDQLYVTANPIVKSGLNAESVQWAFSTREGGNWHPLTWLSHLLDVQFFGLNPAGHHGTSLALHVANVLLLFWLLRLLTGKIWPSWIVAALFAVHPLRVESVAWVSERKDVLSGLWFMLTLLAYAKYTGRGGGAGGGDQGSGSKVQSSVVGNGKAKGDGLDSGTVHLKGLSRAYGYYLLALLGFTLGLMSKPMLVTVPCVLLLLDVWPLQRFKAFPSVTLGAKRLIIEKIPFFLLTLAASIITFRAQDAARAVMSTGDLSVPDRVGNAFFACAKYLWKTILPVDLVPLYPLPASPDLLPGLLSGAAIVVVTIFGLQSFRRLPAVPIGWLWFLGMLVPVIGLVQVGMQSMADRYTYLPSIGLFIAVVFSAAELAVNRPQRRILIGIASACVAVCAVLTSLQTRLWKNSETLFRHTLKVVPDNPVALHSYGNVMVDQGKIPEAESYFDKAVRLSPNYAEALTDLGLAVVMNGRLDEGIQHYRRAIQLKPYLENAHYNLARALVMRGQFVEAEASYQEALRLKPQSLDSLLGLAEAQAAQGKTSEAQASLQKALTGDPRNPAAMLAMGELLGRDGKFSEADALFQRAVEGAPADPAIRRRYGLFLAAQGKNPEALIQLEEHVRLQPGPEGHFNMGVVRESLRDYAAAAASYRECLRLAPDSPPALNNLAWLLATCPEASVRNGPEAVSCGEKLCHLTQYREPMFIGTLAAAYAEAGRFAEAVKAAEQARALADKAGNKTLADRNAALLEFYRQGKPFRTGS